MFGAVRFPYLVVTQDNLKGIPVGAVRFPYSVVTQDNYKGIPVGGCKCCCRLQLDVLQLCFHVL